MREEDNTTPNKQNQSLRQRLRSGLTMFKLWQSNPLPNGKLTRKGSLNSDLNLSAPLPAINQTIQNDSFSKEEKLTEQKQNILLLSGSSIHPLISSVSETVFFSIWPFISQCISNFFKTNLYKMKYSNGEKCFPSSIFKDSATLASHLKKNQTLIEESSLPNDRFLLKIILFLMHACECCIADPKINCYQHFKKTIEKLKNAPGNSETHKPLLENLLKEIKQAEMKKIVIILSEEKYQGILSKNKTLLTELIPLFLKKVSEVTPGFSWHDFVDSNAFELACERNGYTSDTDTKDGFIVYLLSSLLPIHDHCVKNPDENHFTDFDKKLKFFIGKCVFDDINKILRNTLLTFLSQANLSVGLIPDNQKNELFYSRSFEPTKATVSQIFVGIKKFNVLFSLTDTLITIPLPNTPDEFESYQQKISSVIDNNILFQWLLMKLKNKDLKQLEAIKEEITTLRDAFRNSSERVLIEQGLFQLQQMLTDFIKHSNQDSINLFYAFHDVLAKFICDNYETMPWSLIKFLVEFNESIKKLNRVYIRPMKSVFYSGRATSELLSKLMTDISKTNDHQFFNDLTTSLLKQLLVACKANPSVNYFYHTQNLMRTLCSYLPDNSIKILFKEFINIYSTNYECIERLEEIAIEEIKEKKLEAQEESEIHQEPIDKQREKMARKFRRTKEKGEIQEKLGIENLASAGVYLADKTLPIEDLNSNIFELPQKDIRGDLFLKPTPSTENPKVDLNISTDEALSLKNMSNTASSTPPSTPPVSPIKSNGKSSFENMLSTFNEDDYFSDSSDSDKDEEKKKESKPKSTIKTVNLLNQQYLSITNPELPSEIVYYNVQSLYNKLVMLPLDLPLKNDEITEQDEFSCLFGLQRAASRLLKEPSKKIRFKDFEKLFEIEYTKKTDIEKWKLYDVLISYRYTLTTESIVTAEQEGAAKKRKIGVELLVKELGKLPIASNYEKERKDEILRRADAVLVLKAITEQAYNELFEIPEKTTELTPLERYLRGFQFLFDSSSFDEMSEFTAFYNEIYLLCWQFLNLFSVPEDLAATPISQFVKTYYEESIKKSEIRIRISDVSLINPEIIAEWTKKFETSLKEYNYNDKSQGENYKEKLLSQISALIELTSSLFKSYEDFNSRNNKFKIFFLDEFLQNFKDFKPPKNFTFQKTIVSKQPQEEKKDPEKNEDSLIQTSQKEEEGEEELENHLEENKERLRLSIYREQLIRGYRSPDDLEKARLQKHKTLALNPAQRKEIKADSYKRIYYFYDTFSQTLNEDLVLNVKKIILDINENERNKAQIKGGEQKIREIKKIEKKLEKLTELRKEINIKISEHNKAIRVDLMTIFNNMHEEANNTATINSQIKIKDLLLKVKTYNKTVSQVDSFLDEKNKAVNGSLAKPQKLTELWEKLIVNMMTILDINSQTIQNDIKRNKEKKEVTSSKVKIYNEVLQQIEELFIKRNTNANTAPTEAQELTELQKEINNKISEHNTTITISLKASVSTMKSQGKKLTMTPEIKELALKVKTYKEILQQIDNPINEKNTDDNKSSTETSFNVAHP